MPIEIVCNKILVNPKEIWVELIDVAFIEDDLNFVTISRLSYEDDVHIEHNDQVNYILNETIDNLEEVLSVIKR